MKASIFISSGVLLLGSIRGAMCAADLAAPKTQISSKAHLDVTDPSTAPSLAAEVKVQNNDASFDDPGGYIKSTSGPKANHQALHSLDDHNHPQAAIHLNHMMVKCNDRDLQSLCNSPPFNIRCAEGCDSSTVCAIVVDHPHVLCESECTCIAGDKATIPTINEFADLE
ncbi:hypothetical protein N0V93_005139 [Gnomoniopsis smithogilvyi]|uniref:Uncharacterized protein n=1 Tax=Gnomoniopsis smithogilvyi TaxID=1191159 RepID=A0A9W9CXV5_9PEZI|nr:hypothetical protein N0V93_005139 [Gnomoniopsis smithogilvyi]